MPQIYGGLQCDNQEEGYRFKVTLQEMVMQQYKIMIDAVKSDLVISQKMSLKDIVKSSQVVCICLNYKDINNKVT